MDEPQFKRKLEANVSKHFKNVLLTEQDRKDFEKWSNKLYKAFLNGPDSTADHFYDIVQELLPYGDEERLSLHFLLNFRILLISELFDDLVS